MYISIYVCIHISMYATPRSRRREQNELGRPDALIDANKGWGLPRVLGGSWGDERCLMSEAL